MSKSQHPIKDGDPAFNQNGGMSDDPGDGGRKSFTLGEDGETPMEKAPESEQERIEAFGKRGSAQ
jgi:hypothetical protein